MMNATMDGHSREIAFTLRFGYEECDKPESDRFDPKYEYTPVIQTLLEECTNVNSIRLDDPRDFTDDFVQYNTMLAKRYDTLNGGQSYGVQFFKSKNCDPFEAPLEFKINDITDDDCGNYRILSAYNDRLIHSFSIEMNSAVAQKSFFTECGTYENNDDLGSPALHLYTEMNECEQFNSPKEIQIGNDDKSTYLSYTTIFDYNNQKVETFLFQTADCTPAAFKQPLLLSRLESFVNSCSDPSDPTNVKATNTVTIDDVQINNVITRHFRDTRYEFSDGDVVDRFNSVGNGGSSLTSSVVVAGMSMMTFLLTTLL
eukprot:Awhi_evm1s14683